MRRLRRSSSSPGSPQSFDGFADGYDQFVTLQQRLQGDDWLEKLNLRGERALDAGCGAGHTTVRLAATFDQVIGLDLSAALIRLAQQRRPHP